MGVVAERLTDKKKKKIVADYLETQSINATAKKNGVSWGTVRSVLDGMGEIEEKLEQKKEQNTVDILAYINGFLRPTFNQVIRNFSQRS